MASAKDKSKNIKRKQPHARTDDYFQTLKARTDNEDLLVLLDGLNWIGTLLEEVGIAVEHAGDESVDSLAAVEDKLDEVVGAIGDKKR